MAAEDLAQQLVDDGVEPDYVPQALQEFAEALPAGKLKSSLGDEGSTKRRQFVGRVRSAMHTARRRERVALPHHATPTRRLAGQRRARL